jgi:hypothetical protein
MKNICVNCKYFKEGGCYTDQPEVFYNQKKEEFIVRDFIPVDASRPACMHFHPVHGEE